MRAGATWAPARVGKRQRMKIRLIVIAMAVAAAALVRAPLGAQALRNSDEIGREVAVPRHLQDGEEFEIGLRRLLAHGKRLFSANWTAQEGGGRPQTKGTGAPLADHEDP